MELKLYIKQTKIFNAQGQEVYIAGGNPQSLVQNLGQLPAPRRWDKYNNYLDVTDQVSDLYKLKLTWTLQRNEFGAVSAQTEQKKSASGLLTFEGEAYRLIKQWLIDDVSAPLNRIDVQIKHEGCGSYTDWAIRAIDLTWCEDTTCTFDITLKQQEENIDCIQRTLIADNWQGWFGNTDTPSSGKKHPRFSYCNEIRPNGMLTGLWFVIALVMPLFTAFIALIAAVWNSIVFVLVAILAIVQFFINIVGGDDTNIKNRIQDLKDSRITLNDVKDVVGNFFVESAGCGREHPAPLIRDYISNVCGKCGITVTPLSAPIFFNSQMPLQTSMDKQANRGAIARYNPHYNACYLGAVSAKGIRRQQDVSVFTGATANTSDWWKPENTPLLTLEQFLDQLQGLYNASWRVTNNTLYFQRKDYWIDNQYAFDFSKTASDRNLLLEGICFEWDEVKDPVIIKGLYTADASDTPGNAALAYMNGTVVNGNSNLHPNLSGTLDKTTQFGATKFRLDGASNDYIMDAMQTISNSAIASTATLSSDLFRQVSTYFQAYADYALLIQSETTTLPKILLWEPSSGFSNAKCVRYYACTGNVSGASMPAVNPRYNNTPVAQWVEKHRPDTYVSGSKANIAGSTNFPYGYYTVRGTFGGTLYQSPAFLVNYPMFFAPDFEGSMWDLFHWVDDPLNNPTLHQNFTAKLELCCETLQRIKPFEDGSEIILGQKAKMPTGFFVEGYINELTVSYDPSDRLGQYIEIKGRI